MNAPYCLGLLAALTAFPASAQDSACPPLPADSSLQWQRQVGDDFTVCRGLQDGTPVLGLMFTPKPTISPRRGNRREQGRIGAHEVYWHQPEIADGSGTYKRVTVIELGHKRHVQAWIDADSQEQLQQLLQSVQGIALD